MMLPLALLAATLLADQIHALSARQDSKLVEYSSTVENTYAAIKEASICYTDFAAAGRENREEYDKCVSLEAAVDRHLSSLHKLVSSAGLAGTDLTKAQLPNISLIDEDDADEWSVKQPIAPTQKLQSQLVHLTQKGNKAISVFNMQEELLAMYESKVKELDQTIDTTKTCYVNYSLKAFGNERTGRAGYSACFLLHTNVENKLTRQRQLLRAASRSGDVERILRNKKLPNVLDDRTEFQGEYTKSLQDRLTALNEAFEQATTNFKKEEVLDKYRVSIKKLYDSIDTAETCYTDYDKESFTDRDQGKEGFRTCLQQNNIVDAHLGQLKNELRAVSMDMESAIRRAQLPNVLHDHTQDEYTKALQERLLMLGQTAETASNAFQQAEAMPAYRSGVKRLEELVANATACYVKFSDDAFTQAAGGREKEKYLECETLYRQFEALSQQISEMAREKAAKKELTPDALNKAGLPNIIDGANQSEYSRKLHNQIENMNNKSHEAKLFFDQTDNIINYRGLLWRFNRTMTDTTGCYASLTDENINFFQSGLVGCKKQFESAKMLITTFPDIPGDVLLKAGLPDFARGSNNHELVASLNSLNETSHDMDEFASVVASEGKAFMQELSAAINETTKYAMQYTLLGNLKAGKSETDAAKASAALAKQLLKKIQEKPGDIVDIIFETRRGQRA